MLFPETTVIMFAACEWFRQQICKILSVGGGEGGGGGGGREEGLHGDYYHS